MPWTVTPHLWACFDLCARRACRGLDGLGWTIPGMTGVALQSSGVCHLCVTGITYGTEAQDIGSANVCALLFLTAKANAGVWLRNNTD